MRGALGLGIVLGFVGCGLALAPSGSGPGIAPDGAPLPDSAQPPTPEAATPDRTVPPAGPLAFNSEQLAPDGTVVAMAEDEATGITALMEEGTTYSAYPLGVTTAVFSIVAPGGRPSSFAPLPTGVDPKAPRSLYTLGVGLFASFADGTVASYGDNATGVRVVRRGGDVFLATSPAGGGTKIYACPPSPGAGTGPDCATGRLIYDTVELAGFTLSRDRLRLVGLTGTGTALQLVSSVRATLDGTFVTPVAVPIALDALGEAEEVVAVSDDGGKLAVRAKCRNTPGRTCLAAFTR